MNKDEINKRFKEVREKVEAMSKQQESEIGSKVEAIRQEAAKKFQSAVGLT